jgi:hypothetical protein
LELKRKRRVLVLIVLQEFVVVSFVWDFNPIEGRIEAVGGNQILVIDEHTRKLHIGVINGHIGV